MSAVEHTIKCILETVGGNSTMLSNLRFGFKLARDEFEKTFPQSNHHFPRFKNEYDKWDGEIDGDYRNHPVYVAWSALQTTDEVRIVKQFSEDIHSAIQEYERIPMKHRKKFLSEWMSNRSIYQRLKADGIDIYSDHLYHIYNSGNQPKSHTRNGLMLFWAGLNAYRKNPDRYIS